MGALLGKARAKAPAEAQTNLLFIQEIRGEDPNRQAVVIMGLTRDKADQLADLHSQLEAHEMLPDEEKSLNFTDITAPEDVDEIREDQPEAVIPLRPGAGVTPHTSISESECAGIIADPVYLVDQLRGEGATRQAAFIRMSPEQAIETAKLYAEARLLRKKLEAHQKLGEDEQIADLEGILLPSDIEEKAAQIERKALEVMGDITVPTIPIRADAEISLHSLLTRDQYDKITDTGLPPKEG
jgi:hypothetical protein